eukprot:TRINITY_DN10555_c0_g1_i1.p1 TRINITY_DN10555_c0_g1~~TRINITY_DN10555_c0_g1_i1.p1  ORF type:complete len:190 (+),score=36.89 TRINITY_DN10555_c0_g1_i1:716-1285(+)
MYSITPDNNMPATRFVNAVMAEHFAAFESRDHTTGKLNITRVKEEMRLIQQVASNKSKTIVVDTWPGPMVAPMTWATDYPTPSSNPAIAKAMLLYFPVSLAAYLTLAEDNILFQYIWWYSVTDGAIPCPGNQSTCAAPADWYNVSRDIGSPLGPATVDVSGTVYTRRFANAVSVWNMVDELESSVTFHS